MESCVLDLQRHKERHGSAAPAGGQRGRGGGGAAAAAEEGGGGEEALQELDSGTLVRFFADKAESAPR